MDEHTLRFNVVDTARLFLGATQGSADHKLIVDTYNAHQPLARGYKLKMTDPWCAGFVSAISIMTDMTDIIPTEVGAQELLQKFQAIGEWQEDERYFPKVGDVIFYDWDDRGYGDSKGRADHVGIVEALGTYSFTVIEGNMEVAGVSQVGRREVDYDGRFIRGFGIPDYASKAKDPDVLFVDTDELNMRAEPSTGGEILAKLPTGTQVDVGIIEGGWAYVTISGYVSTEYLSATKPKASYTTTDNLNLRDAPGGKILLTIPQGKTVSATGNTEKYAGVLWREIRYQNTAGWASGEYLS